MLTIASRALLGGDVALLRVLASPTAAIDALQRVVNSSSSLGDIRHCTDGTQHNSTSIRAHRTGTTPDRDQATGASTWPAQDQRCHLRSNTYRTYSTVPDIAGVAGGGTGLLTEQRRSGASSGLQLDSTAPLSQLSLGRSNLASSGQSSNSSGRETVSSSSKSSTLGEAGSGSGNLGGGGAQEKGGPGGASSRAFTSRDPVLSRVLRESLAAEEAVAGLFCAQERLSKMRPDLAAANQDATEAVQKLRKLVPDYRARPSLLNPVWSAVGLVIGTAAALAPPKLAAAISGGAQEALTELYTEQLRTLTMLGTPEETAALREAVRKLRDTDRAPVDAPKSADIISLAMSPNLGSVTLPESVGGVVKLGLQTMFRVAAKL